MDESSWTDNCSTLTVQDSSGYGNHGKACPNGYGPVTAPGKVGNAGSFDGTDDYVDCGNGSSLQFGANTDFTVALWLKSENLTNSALLVRKGGGGTDKGFYLRQLEKYTAVINDGITKIEHQFNLIPLSEWQYYVVTFDRDGYMRGYLNGVEANNPRDISMVGDINIAHSLLISDKSYYFNGYLDDVRIYNRALSAEEIQATYNATK
jgi:hypothetical protein